LGEGFCDLAALPDVAAHLLYDAESAAWEKIQPAIKAGKVDPTILQGHSASAMRTSLEFLLRCLGKRKVLKNKILESLTILLMDPAWLCVAQQEPVDLHSHLLEVFVSSEAMKKRLSEDPPDAELLPDKTDIELASRNADDINDIAKNMVAGARIMKEFGWAFPPPSTTGSDRDSAMEGFKAFHKGVTRLSVVAERLSNPSAMEEYAKTVTEDLVKFWPDILRFLASMREERRSFVSQIKFVVQKLSEYLPRFRTLTEDTQINFSDSMRTSRVEEIVAF